LQPTDQNILSKIQQVVGQTKSSSIKDDFGSPAQRSTKSSTTSSKTAPPEDDFFTPLSSNPPKPEDDFFQPLSSSGSNGNIFHSQTNKTQSLFQIEPFSLIFPYPYSHSTIVCQEWLNHFFNSY
jgi:hypothetical protein